MTNEKARDLLSIIEVKKPNELIVNSWWGSFVKDYKDALQTAIKSLEAWGKVKEEILNPNEMDCFENSNIWQVWFLNIIDKHLAEAQNETVL